MTKEELKKTLAVQTSLDSSSRKFVFSKGSQEGYEKKYIGIPNDVRLVRIAQDSVAMVSDCYIMYAVSMLRIADRYDIQRFLIKYSNANPKLAIPDVSDIDIVLRALKRLIGCGLLFRHNYPCWNANGDKFDVALYSIDSNSQNLMNRVLNLRTTPIPWIQASRLVDLIGYACAAHIAAYLMNTSAFDEVLSAVLKSKYIGTFNIPVELQFRKNEEVFKVAIMNAYLIHEEQVQTKSAFVDSAIFKVNMIKNYIGIRQGNCLPRVVVAVHDTKDLSTIGALIKDSSILSDELLPYVYFAGEGSIDTFGQNGFLVMERDDSELGYHFLAEMPDFI